MTSLWYKQAILCVWGGGRCWTGFRYLLDGGRRGTDRSAHMTVWYRAGSMCALRVSLGPVTRLLWWAVSAGRKSFRTSLHIGKTKHRIRYLLRVTACIVFAYIMTTLMYLILELLDDWKLLKSFVNIAYFLMIFRFFSLGITLPWEMLLSDCVLGVSTDVISTES